MFYDQEPPIESFDNEFPTFNTVVTVSNCWYYLSLLERFVDITKDMPEDTLKIYLVRAEYRYFKWVTELHRKELMEEPSCIPPVGKSC
jgi:hypothetical protein